MREQDNIGEAHFAQSIPLHHARVARLIHEEWNEETWEPVDYRRLSDVP